MRDYPPYVKKIALPVGLFLAYCVALRIGLYIHPLDTHPTLVFSSVGIALAAVILYGYRASVAIAFAAFIVPLVAGAPLSASLVFAAAGTLAPLSGAYVLRNYVGFSTSLQRLADISGILFAGALSAAVSATLGLGAFYLAGLTAGSLSSSTWLTHWVGDTLGVILFTPFILKWCTRPLSGRSAKPRIEKYATVTAVSLTSLLIFWMPQTHFAYYFVFMPLTWAALRTGQRGTSLSLVCFGVIAIFGTALGYGPFVRQGLLLMIFIVTTGALLYIVAGVVESRKLGLRMLEGHVDDLERALHQMSSEDVAKTKFLSVLAHELRNPLAAVLSSVELLKLSGGQQTADTAEHLETIDQQVNVMAGLLDDLLDISRISHNKLVLKRETISLDDVIDRSVRAAQAMVLRRGHTLTVTKSPRDILLDADPIRLEQIFLNLLSNATKYTEPHGSITVSTGTEGSMAVVRVRDTGIGIPRHLLARIFEPYYQVERGQVLTEGLGVGLSLSRQLVQMHGGTIEARSEGEHQGSEFIVRLPLAAPAKRPAARKTKRAQDSAPEVAHRPLKILVVDDNAGVTDALARLLSLGGHEVARAYAGAEAIQKARLFHPDVAILDIGLPDMTGYEVARRLRSNADFKGALIALTGYGQEHDKKMARDAGFYKHLTKPVSHKSIEAVLRKIAHSKANKLDR